MRITCPVPCGLDPQQIKMVYSAAWRAAKKERPKLGRAPRVVSQIGTRKHDNPAWVDPTRPHRIWINPKRTMLTHAYDWYTALCGKPRADKDLFKSIPGAVLFSPAPKSKKREKREPVRAEVIEDLRMRIAEWDTKRKDAQRSLKLAKTKLRGYRASLRGHLRELRKSDGSEAIGYGEQQFAAHMRERLTQGE